MFLTQSVRRVQIMYYKISCEVSGIFDPALLDLSNLSYLDQYQSQHTKSSSFYLYCIKSNTLTILAITTHTFDKTQDLDISINQYLSLLPLTISNYTTTSIFYLDYNNFIVELDGFMTPETQNNIYLVDAFELEKHLIPNDLGRFVFKEMRAIDYSTQISQELLGNFQTEINRISNSAVTSFIGHPVHYHIQCAHVDDAETVAMSLTSNLQSHHRLINNHFVKVYVNHRFKMSKDLSIELAQHMASGGTLFFDLSTDFDSSDLKGITAQINHLCHSISQSQHEVLYIFYTSNNNTSVFDYMNEHMNINLITIKPDSLDFYQAKEYLTQKFIESELDLNLLDSSIYKDELYTLSQLDSIVSQSLQNKLVLSNFPIYAKVMEQKFSPISIPEPTQEGMSNLNQLIGLQSVKQKIVQIINAHNNLKNIPINLNISTYSNHMVFTGNPGTAKTTVARIVGQIFKENQILSVGDFYELSRSDLIQPFVGWTSKHIHEVFEKAKGSVLFIDEAYSLMDSGYNGYGEEAISTIIQEMENNRDNIVVIFAGYPEKMEKFINSNPGLKSRIKHFVQFDDYSATELLKIAHHMLNQNNFSISQDGLFILSKHIVNSINNSNFGNARDVRNLIEQAITVHLSNLNPGKDSILSPSNFILTEQDFYFITKSKNQSLQLIN